MNTEKRGRGRPRKSDQGRMLSREKTKMLAKEIRFSLGGVGKLITVDDLLRELNKIGFGGGESLWRKYEAGLVAMSPGRMFDVAAFAYSKGARGAAVRGALLSSRHELDQAVNLKNRVSEEAALTGMVEAIHVYLSIIDPFNAERIDEVATNFDKMVDLAKETAWHAYEPKMRSKIPEGYFIQCLAGDDMVLEPEVLDALEMDNENDGDYLKVKDTLSPIFRTSVPKPPWAKIKKS